jgi:hypothetical protein
MLTTIKTIIGCAALSVTVCGQAVTVDSYTTASSDESNIYGTGVIQANMTNFCNSNPGACSHYSHLYAQTLTLTSPSGRVSSCNFSPSDPASDPVDLSCETDLPFDDEIGNYTLQNQQSAHCTYAGTFFSSLTDLVLSVGYAVTYFQNPSTLTGSTGTTCYYANTACNPGTTPTCGGGWNLLPQVGSTCSQYAWTYFLTFTLESGAKVCSLVGIGGQASGPGNCK